MPDILDDGELTAELSARRLELMGEFDKANPDAALSLAKLYLSVGMAPEARAVLADFAGSSPPVQLYDEIARLMDGHALEQGATLWKPDCLGEQALWRSFAAARAGSHKEALQAEAASGRALERLPLYPRQVVAATIGLSAVAEGDWDTARRLEAMGKRAASSDGGGSTGPMLILSSKLADWHGEPLRAEALLKRATAPELLTADAALIMLAERALSSEHRIGENTDALRERLGALALRERANGLGAKAFELEARLFARMARRDETIELLSHAVEAGLYPGEAHVALLSELATEPGMQELSRPLGLIYLEDPKRYEPALAQVGFRRALIHSLAELGVPVLASPVVQPGDLKDPFTATALAESYLRTDQPREAIELAQSLPDGPDKDRILGEALLASGQVQQAQTHLPQADALRSEDGGSNVAALREHITGALNSGDVEAALAASELLLLASPSAANAEQVALLALEAGQREVPQAAAGALEMLAPERLAAIETLFTSVPQGTDANDPKAVAAYLERLEAEMSMIEGMLGDG